MKPKLSSIDMQYIGENLRVAAKEDDPITAILHSVGIAGQLLLNRKISKFKHSDIFIEPPVDTRIFFRDYVREENFPVQQAAIDAVFGLNPYIWDNTYNEFVLLWGMGSGKDHTSGKILAYAAYWLKLLKNAQKYFHLGSGTSIDIANMCINARLAKDIFFEDFKNTISRTMIPGTDRNWFEDHGVDIREGKDVRSNQVNFGNGIVAHSLNSETQSDIGMNPLLVVFDEIGGFDVTKAEALYNFSRKTQASRFASTKSHKRLLLSFKRSDNDFMMMRYEEANNEPRVYRSKAATWVVNKNITKEDLAEEYAADPEGAKRVYECEGDIQEGGYFRYGKSIRHTISKDRGHNPIVGNLHRIYGLSKIQFKDWFVGNPEYKYFGHVDLGTGKDGNDCAGVGLVHTEKMNLDFDPEYISELLKENININEIIGKKRYGIKCDIGFQVKARPGKEVQFSSIIDFFLKLRDERFFNISMVTYDGFSSIGERQRLNEKGITSDLLSVDRTCGPYDTLKSLVYLGLFSSYWNPILVRELEELIYIPDAQGKYTRRKIGHPDRSMRRKREEGDRRGSKDVADGIAGAVWNCVDNYKANFSFGFIELLRSKTEDFKDPRDIEREQWEEMQQKVKSDHAEEIRKEMLKVSVGGKRNEYWKTLVDSY